MLWRLFLSSDDFVKAMFASGIVVLPFDADDFAAVDSDTSKAERAFVKRLATHTVHLPVPTLLPHGQRTYIQLYYT